MKLFTSLSIVLLTFSMGLTSTAHAGKCKEKCKKTYNSCAANCNAKTKVADIHTCLDTCAGAEKDCKISCKANPF